MDEHQGEGFCYISLFSVKDVLAFTLYVAQNTKYNQHVIGACRLQMTMEWKLYD